ncbi:DUF2905 domain-containing protein [Paenibacillus flagellatus]|uniref:DUF2905 domain-containing protein n=1 Tax=Paenibacillus flagellatus TaxID=2211139 RepID=A0A2V5K562_9BACL|nr:DUF2905 domain-containing protein [Paenibacillus flagellatus]PYI54505.1 DUF2905 domain-containing protein [Paenibacillus flagellatus]
MHIPKIMIVSGIALVAIGLVWMLVGRFVPLGKLPGDIAIEKGSFKFYFPVATCVIVSAALSLIAFVVRWFMKE